MGRQVGFHMSTEDIVPFHSFLISSFPLARGIPRSQGTLAELTPVDLTYALRGKEQLPVRDQLDARDRARLDPTGDRVFILPTRDAALEFGQLRDGRLDVDQWNSDVIEYIPCREDGRGRILRGRIFIAFKTGIAPEVDRMYNRIGRWLRRNAVNQGGILKFSHVAAENLPVVDN